MSIILDIIIVAIIALSMIICYKKGFVKSLFSSFGFIAAVLLALLLTAPISALINDAFVYDSTYESVKEVIGEVQESCTAEDVAARLEGENPKMFALLSNLGFNVYDIITEKDEETDLTSDEMAAKIATPAAKLLSNVFAFLISVVIAYIAFFVLTKVFDLLSKLPVFNITNKTFGLIYGAFLGIFRASIFAIIISGLYPIVVGLFSTESAVLNAVSNTFVLNFFIDHNLFVFLLKSIF